LLIGFASEDDEFDYQLENDPSLPAPYRTRPNDLARGIKIKNVE